MMRDEKSFGTILYRARQEKGLTVKQLADAMGVTINTIYSWEGNTKSPMLTNLQKVCKVLDLSIQINGDGEVRRI